MSKKKGTIAVAMSGGVDSSVCAALLVEQSYDVFGIMLRLWSEPGMFATSRDNRCCTRDQMLDAHFVARKLGIPFEIIDAQDVFKQNVVDPWIADYERGITPNPCLNCNRHIRFTHLLQEAFTRGATHLATGHYAQISENEDGMFSLHMGADSHKDQSYVLSVLTQEQLRHAMFPVGQYTKPEVRELAERFGLPVASKSDSQDLCFVADGDYRRMLRDFAPEAFQTGSIVLTSGEVLGQHNGLPNYTIGQRKGLGISWNEPLYVVGKDPQTNTLTVGPKSALGQDILLVKDVNWISGSPPTREIKADVKTRYKARAVPASLNPTNGESIEVHLDDPLPDVTPGQGAVFYDGDRVLGGGVIAQIQHVLVTEFAE